MEFVDADAATGWISDRQFIGEFLQSYRRNRCLWDTTHPAYASKHTTEDYLDLVQIMRKVKPDACINDVKRKVNSLRSAYRRELKKMISLQEERGEVYKPTLWYFDHLDFLRDKVTIDGTSVEQGYLSVHSEEDGCFEKNRTTPVHFDEETVSFTSSSLKADVIDVEEEALPLWAHDKDFVKEFIECYRKQRCLWDPTFPLYTKNTRHPGYEALLAIMQKRNPFSKLHHVTKKINSLRCVYRRELKKVQQSKEDGGPVYKSTLWYYDLLNFLENVTTYRLKKEAPKKEPETGAAHKKNLHEFIKCFHSHNALWDATSSDYKSKKLCKKGLASLLRILQRVNPNATLEDVKNKLKSLRSTYRRYVQQDSSAEKRLPCLWYFRHLNFLRINGDPLDPIPYKQEPDEAEDTELDEQQVVVIEEISAAKIVKNETSFDERRAEIEKTRPSLYLPPPNRKHSHPDRTSPAVHTLTKVWEEKLIAMPKMQRILAERAINEIIFQGELEALSLELVQRITSNHPPAVQIESHTTENPRGPTPAVSDEIIEDAEGYTVNDYS